MSQFHPLRVASLKNETRDAVVVTLEVSDALRDAFRFTQGQHLTLRAMLGGEEVRRSYSICSAPFEGHIQLAIKRVDEGLFSTWANHELRPGHTIECMTPSGRFNVPLMPETERHHLAFAVGSGITPIISIMKATLADEPKSRFTLVYGNRASSSVIFKEELADLKDRYLGRLNLIFILSREHQEIELFNGRIDGAKCNSLLEQWIDPESVDVAYICGPQLMMEEVQTSLQAHGIARESIKTELFTSGQPPTRVRRAEAAARATEHCRVTVLRDGLTRTFDTPNRQQTLLDAALGLGIELPYSCKGGVCSTCRCKMTRGEVEMDNNFALEDYEVARGFILPCQSYPLSSEIMLDFDQES